MKTQREVLRSIHRSWELPTDNEAEHKRERATEDAAEEISHDFDMLADAIVDGDQRAKLVEVLKRAALAPDAQALFQAIAEAHAPAVAEMWAH